MSSVAPEFATDGCSFHCPIPGCKGNRLEKAFEPGATAKYKIITPHHKNSWRGIEGNNFTIQDEQLTQLLNLYLGYCRKVLVRMEPSVKELFTTNQGRPYVHPTFTQWFYGFQNVYQPPFPSPIPPSKFRGVFADEVMMASQQGMGPTVEQAARMMGNTPGTLAKVGWHGLCALTPLHALHQHT